MIVLRSLRLLRIFKLVRPMRHQMMVMIRTMSSVMTFFALLFLFMFTFAILGMNLFGGKFYFNGVRSRSSFDSFPSAMTTVFQVSFLYMQGRKQVANFGGAWKDENSNFK